MFQFNFRRDMGTYLFGLWIVLFGVLGWIFYPSGQFAPLVNVLMGVLLIVSGVFHLIEL
jgi:hypothetical protein